MTVTQLYRHLEKKLIQEGVVWWCNIANNSDSYINSETTKYCKEGIDHLMTGLLNKSSVLIFQALYTVFGGAERF